MRAVRRDRGVRVSRLIVWEVDNVNEEWDEGGRERKAREEEISVGEDTFGGSIGWVHSAWNVLSADIKDTRGFREESVDLFEYIVGFVIVVAALPPAFDDNCIVSIDKNISPLRDDRVEGAYK